MPEPPILPDHHFREGAVDVHSDHTSHDFLLANRRKGSVGAHDNYGSALSAQPGKSQRRPATNSSSRLIVQYRPARTSCSRCLYPGWSYHTPESSRSQPDRKAPPIFIPVTNPIESVFATVRHRTVRMKGALSQDTARLMVFKLVMAAAKTWRRLQGQNQLPKVIEGVKFRDGIEVVPEAKSAA